MKVWTDEDGNRVAAPEKGEVFNTEFWKTHPEIDIFHGVVWDIETEQSIHCNVVNFFSRRIGHPHFREIR